LSAVANAVATPQVGVKAAIGRPAEKAGQDGRAFDAILGEERPSAKERGKTGSGVKTEERGVSVLDRARLKLHEKNGDDNEAGKDTNENADTGMMPMLAPTPLRETEKAVPDGEKAPEALSLEATAAEADVRKADTDTKTPGMSGPNTDKPRPSPPRQSENRTLSKPEADAAPPQDEPAPQIGPASPLTAMREPARSSNPPETMQARAKAPDAAPASSAMDGEATAELGRLLSADAPLSGAEGGTFRRDDGQRRQPARMEAASSTEQPAVRVNVLAAQTIPAPAISATGQALVASLGGEPAMEASSRETLAGALPRETSGNNTVHTLKIQLHPAELGTVTAKLTATGAQLSIELQVENPEARRRLHSDGDSIVKALRGMGFEVDRVTVQQATGAGSAAVQGAGGREGSFTAPDGGARDAEHQQQRGGSERQNGEGRGSGQDGGGHDRRNTRGGVYI